MPRVEVTNKELLNLRDDINTWANSSPAFRFFMINKIAMFFKQNGFILNIADKKVLDIIRTYAIHDKDDRPVTIVKEDGKTHYTFIDEATQKEYVDTLNEFLGRHVSIEM